ncbi:MAG: hypothetical protein HOQ38_01255, partial [Nonomuraea sp.]|nr:hypothetical protein [Nonomuraea sp.]
SERDVELVASPPRQVLDRLLNARAKRHRRGRLLMAVAASVAVIAVGGTVWTTTRQDAGQGNASAPVAASQSSASAGKAEENSPLLARDAAPDTSFKAAPTPSAMATRARKRPVDGQVFRGENKVRDYYATVSAVPGESGTELLVSVRNIPVGTTCGLAVYDDAGGREVTGSWTVTRDTYRKESVFGLETAVPMGDIARFEVVDRAGRVLVKVEGPARK